MQILANLDDIQANLDNLVAPVTDENTELLQLSAARIIRGNLNGAIDNVILQSWKTPEETPEMVREAAGKLIAAQHYFNEISQSTGTIEKDSLAQKRYDEAMEILKGIIGGSIVLEEVPLLDSMNVLDFFPVDNSDQAFTKDMLL